MSGIEDRLRDLARSISGPTDEVTAAAKERVRDVLGVASIEGDGEERPPTRRRRIGKRGLLVLAGAIVAGSATAGAISTLGGGGSSPVACQVFPDRGAGPQQLAFYEPAARVDDAGDAVIAWVARGGTVQAVSRVASGGWQAPRAVSGQLPTRYLPYSLALVMGSQGQTTLGWTSKDTSLVDWSPGAGWGSPTRLSARKADTAPQIAPVLSLNSRGQGAALFSAAQDVTYGSGGGASIAGMFPVLVRREPGGPWRTVLSLSGQNAAGISASRARASSWFFVPQIVLDEDATTSILGSGAGVAYARLSPGGRRLAYQQVQSEPGPGRPVLGVDMRGNALGLWMRGTNLVAGTLGAGEGRWRSSIIANPGLYDIFLDFAMNEEGDAVVVYRARARRVPGPRFPARSPTARPDRVIEALTYSAATRSWSRPTRLSPLGTAVNKPRVAIDAQGNATVAWVEGPNNGHGVTRIMVARGAGGRWSSGSALSAPAPDPLAPALAVAPSGRAIVAWTGCRGTTAAAYVSENEGTAWTAPRVIG